LSVSGIVFTSLDVEQAVISRIRDIIDICTPFII